MSGLRRGCASKDSRDSPRTEPKYGPKRPAVRKQFVQELAPLDIVPAERVDQNEKMHVATLGHGYLRRFFLDCFHVKTCGLRERAHNPRPHRVCQLQWQLLPNA